nr:MAG TPA: hypothetical protein [Caudoviricetes sp.]
MISSPCERSESSCNCFSSASCTCAVILSPPLSLARFVCAGQKIPRIVERIGF